MSPTTMNDLSPELLHEIVSNFEHSARYHVGRLPSLYTIIGSNFLGAIPPSHNGSSDIATLKSLRLTSKSFNDAASRVLFRARAIKWKIADAPMDDIDTSLFKALSDPNYKLLPLMRGLNFDIRIPGFKFEIQPGKTESHVNKRQVFEGLPSMLQNLSSLNTLKIRSPPFTVEDDRHPGGQILREEDTEVSYDSDEDVGALRLDIELLSRIPQAVAQGISGMERLTDLRVTFPCTHDFLELSNSVPDSVFHKLRHLFLGVTDETGPGGSLEYLIWAEEDEGSWDPGDESFPRSNLQAKYPNVAHASALFGVVDRCPNLESLGIEGTHILDADLLEWQPTNSGLKCLYFDRIKLSAENLITLLSPPASEPATISSVWLEHVDLKSGTWDMIFDHLTASPSLVYINPYNLSYSRGGESEIYIEAPPRAWEDNSCLWSNHEEDERAVVKLVKMLIQRAGGRDKYPDYYGGGYEQYP